MDENRYTGSEKHAGSDETGEVENLRLGARCCNFLIGVSISFSVVLSLRQQQEISNRLKFGEAVLTVVVVDAPN